MKRISLTTLLILGVSAVGLVQADQVILDDLIVDGSACIGQDCVNGESFGFDTLRLKENNLRIKAQDTSSTASFPTNDWQITFNDSSNGGANKFSIDDIDGGRTPFTIEAGAPSHSLYVDDGGRLGLGTSTPVVELHVKDGDTPTLRLEQDGSSGFTPQTWDVAGNETNFFVRDATNGSRLPLRIRPSAPSNSIFVDTDGDVGLNTSSPSKSLHVLRSDGTASALVEEASTTKATRTLLTLTNNGRTRLEINNTSITDGANAGNTWRFDLTNNGVFSFVEDSQPGGAAEFKFSPEGDLTIAGNYFSVTCTSPGSPCAPDYVFAPDYQLMPMQDLAAFIEREGHLPNVPSADDIKTQGGVNMTKMQMTLLEKIEELTLYTLKQQATIRELQSRLVELEKSSNSGR